MQQCADDDIYANQSPRREMRPRYFSAYYLRRTCTSTSANDKAPAACTTEVAVRRHGFQATSFFMSRSEIVLQQQQSMWTIALGSERAPRAGMHSCPWCPLRPQSDRPHALLLLEHYFASAHEERRCLETMSPDCNFSCTGSRCFVICRGAGAGAPQVISREISRSHLPARGLIRIDIIIGTLLHDKQVQPQALQ